MLTVHSTGDLLVLLYFTKAQGYSFKLQNGLLLSLFKKLNDFPVIKKIYEPYKGK